MTTFTRSVNETFHVVSCYTCGVNFGINGEVYTRAVENKEGSVYCPVCSKGMHWTGKTEVENVRERMQRKIDTTKRHNRYLEEKVDRTEKSLRATKGVVTKIKKRVGNGICPCCNRSFKNLHRHMESKHPGFKETIHGIETS